MATFTKLYLTANTPVYTPSTIRGAWDQTAGSVVKSLDSQKGGGGELTQIAITENNSSSTWDVLLYRGISGPLAAQTISGTVNCIIGANEGLATYDFSWHVHIYVTSGDTDTPRGTLLTDYVEALANEWPITTIGSAFASSQSLSSLAISTGDRIVVELGFISRNISTAARAGAIRYGTTNSSGIVVGDLTVGGDSDALAGFIEFSSAITEVTPTARVSQDVIEVLSLPVPAARVGQYVIEVLSATTPVPGRVSQYVVEILSQNVEVTMAESTQFYIVMP